MARKIKIKKTLNFKIDPLMVKDHADQVRSLKQMSKDQNMKLASYGKVIERDGIHNKAFFDIVKLQGMERTKVLDYLKSFDIYRHILLADMERDFINELADKDAGESVQTDSEDVSQNPYEEGKAAGAAGKSFVACPHPIDSAERDDWEQGWKMGQTGIAETMRPKKSARAPAQAAAH